MCCVLCALFVLPGKGRERLLTTDSKEDIVTGSLEGEEKKKKE